MAAFREHVTFSTVIGAGYGAALWHFAGVDPTHAILAGCLCGVSGMLPDLDSDSGKPVREMFGLFAVVGALGALLISKRRLGLDGETAFLAAVAAYVFVRIVLGNLFRKITVHRGMCHSLPAAGIVAAIFYLLYDGDYEYGKYTIAGAAFLGFMSHLILDEIYSVDLRGLVPRLNSFAGTAIKLTSKSVWATGFCWLLLAALLYQIAVNEERAPALFEIPERPFLRRRAVADHAAPRRQPKQDQSTAPQPAQPVSHKLWW